MMRELLKISELLDAESASLPINKVELESAIDIIFHELLFPICKSGCPSSLVPLIKVNDILTKNISNLIGLEEAQNVVKKFLNFLPELRTKLYDESLIYLQNDPAARTLEEIIIAYPGFYGLSIHRISHFLHTLNVPVIPRLFAEHAHSKVGIDIHPGAQIGDRCFIDHGTGIVIGETTKIGDNVKIYQGVTLGALFVNKDLKNKKRHPTIENDVVIYAGATILGGNTVVGHNSTIGGNVWLTKSIVPYSLVFNTSKVIIKNNQTEENSFNYMI